MTLHGIDISRWQTTTPPLDGVDFVIAKASQATYTDSMYAIHRANVRAAGLPFAAYHFADKRVDPRIQARYFMTIAGNADGLALDVEGVNAFSPAQTAAFIDECHVADRRCGLYMSLSGYYENVGQDWRWIAFWADHAPTIPYDVWQYRGSPLDLDYFDGTRDELLALWRTEDDMTITKRKGEDWKPTANATGASNGVLRVTPDHAAAIAVRVPLGTVIRSVAEVTTAAATDNNWRLTFAPDGAPLYMLRRDWEPLVQGGDPAVDAGLADYIARKPDLTPYTGRDLIDSYNAGVARAVELAGTARK